MLERGRSQDPTCGVISAESDVNIMCCIFNAKGNKIISSYSASDININIDTKPMSDEIVLRDVFPELKAYSANPLDKN